MNASLQIFVEFSCLVKTFMIDFDHSMVPLIFCHKSFYNFLQLWFHFSSGVLSQYTAKVITIIKNLLNRISHENKLKEVISNEAIPIKPVIINVDIIMNSKTKKNSHNILLFRWNIHCFFFWCQLQLTYKFTVGQNCFSN